MTAFCTTFLWYRDGTVATHARQKEGTDDSTFFSYSKEESDIFTHLFHERFDFVAL